VDYESNIPGKYRNHIVKVGNEEHGGIYTPPKCIENIKKLMAIFVKWINDKPVDEPILRAALGHYHFALIHPFGDGNGRTARIIEAIILKEAGNKYIPIMLSNYYYRHMDDYYWAFSKSLKNKENSVSDFLEFVLRGVIESLHHIKNRITYFIRKFTLREYYLFLRSQKTITQRQHDLLILLLDNLKSFNLKDLISKEPYMLLYRRVTERTARRDLKKLHERNLISNVENNYFELNLRILG
jgi:Fic family protein